MREQQSYKPRAMCDLVPPPRDWLNLPGLELEGEIERTATTIVVQARTTTDGIPACPGCSSDEAVIAWDIRSRNIRDLEKDGLLVCIVLKRHRYFCKTCKKTFLPPLQFLGRSRLRRTDRLTQKATCLIRERHSTSYVAKATGLCRRSVQVIAIVAAEDLPTPQDVFRRALAGEDAACVIQIDDAHPSCGTLTAILLDGCPLELLKEYTKAAIAAFFFGLQDRDKVRIYVCDLAPFLIDLGHRMYRNAYVVADPYHVIRQIFERLDELMKPLETQVLSEYLREIHEGRLIRPIRKRKAKQDKSQSKTQSIEENPKDPTFAEIRILLRTRRWKLNKVGKDAVDFLQAKFPDIRAGCEYLQGVMALYDINISASDASKAFDRLEAELPPQVRNCFLTFLNLCHQRRDEICAFWQCGWTNAEVESQNGVIKEIDRLGRGLEFATLRRRWLYGHSTSAVSRPSKLLTQSTVLSETRPRKKSLSELRLLQSPTPVPIVGRDGTGWLFQ